MVQAEPRGDIKSDSWPFSLATGNNKSMMDLYARSGHSSRRRERTASSRGPSRSSFSFLFVVNELEFYKEPGADIFRDVWHNELPPRSCTGYSGERAGKVLRYRDGEVMEASDYVWYRGGLGVPGRCYSNLEEAPGYSHAAVFACNPHLPLVVIRDDPLMLDDAKSSMHALHFFHPRHLPGLSQATTSSPDDVLPRGGAPVKYVAGRSPSWMPGLVPSVYANPWLEPPPSCGLGGELAIIIGLMAFSKSGPDVEDVFLGTHGRGGYWHNSLWTSRAAPSYYPRSTQETPRGFYIGVFYDPDNAEGSSQEAIHGFEWNSAVVQETPP
ncbi:hypothetical protein CDD82_3149 [Ophiocordyceps australis]|uniref:Uncharacterized protein n=1 Tax=Ophiocordyceps australis TaxID=1399860 RepID=A0A2C5ZEF2_9HYPO|nr:hypothetical protein CDD82_3149 [Ophiocordyceps australis]